MHGGRRLVAWLCASVICSGCGGDGEPASNSAGAGGTAGGGGQAGSDAGTSCGGAALAWESCYGEHECADVEVPIDWDEPTGGCVSLRILRAKASGTSEGVILFNAGGPGQPGVSLVGGWYPELTTFLPDALARYDLVGFDWRGVGDSSPVECTEPTTLNAWRKTRYAPATSAEKAEAEAALDDFAPGCTANNDPKLLANMDTTSSARDLEAIRKALGQEKINYLGLSYGAGLGATYATLFPDRVRAFVFDSPIGTVTTMGETLERQTVGYEQALARFFADCGADANCAFHGGGGESTLTTAFDALMASIEASGGIAVGNRTLTRIDAGYAVVTMLADADWAGLGAALASAEAGDGEALLIGADRWLGYAPELDAYQPWVDQLYAIYCLDRSWPAGFGYADYWSYIEALDAPTPRLGRAVAALDAGTCVGHPYTTSPTPISAGAAQPMLLLSGNYDPATPPVGAQEMLNALGNGSYLVPVESDGHVQLARNACARGAIDDFLVDPSAPPVTACP